jgi:drug/metabolite transporter (DMT)-like permease
MQHHTHSSAAEPSPVRLLLAFAAIYVIWGSTYLAIRFAIETIPPLMMAGARFLVAGGVMYTWARARGIAHPTSRQWRDAAIAGALMLVGGNGAVVIAEQWVPSGLVALLVAAVPFWMVLLDWGWGSRTKPTARVGVGLAAGIGGVALLAGAPGAGAGGPLEFVGAVMVLFGALSWATGSLYSRYTIAPPQPRMWVAIQMLAGGAMFLPLSAARGEWGSFDLVAVSPKSLLALAFLIVFGALVAYSAYIWLLSVSTPARVGTYAFVNPLVALLLGWALANEPLTVRSAVAASVIVCAVIIITTGASGRKTSGSETLKSRELPAGSRGT